MSSASYRLDRIRRTLDRFENDIPLLDLRVRDLSPERQKSARQFAAALIDQTRAELLRLTDEPADPSHDEGPPCEPAD